MIQPLYADNWSSSSEEEEEDATTTYIDNYTDTTAADTTADNSHLYMIHDIKIRAFNNQKITLHLSLIDAFGCKAYRVIRDDIRFDVYIEALSPHTENIAALLPQLQCFDNTPVYDNTKYTAMGYTCRPLHVWRLRIDRNKLQYIEEFCTRTHRRIFLNTELNDALPLVQKSLGIYAKLPASDGTHRLAYDRMTHPSDDDLLRTPPTSFVCRKLSVDIEVITPPHWTLFPEATEPGCEIIIIACTRQLNDDDAYTTTVLYTDPRRRRLLFDTEAADNRSFVRFDSELAMLRHFVCSIGPANTDLVTGWNVRNFDLKYIYDRCERFYPQLVPLFGNWTLDGSTITFRSVTRKGQNVTLVDCFGIIILDMYDYNKSNVKAKSYKLKDIAQKYLADDKQKLAIDYRDISRFYTDGDDKQFSHLLQYCSVDAEIVLDLMAVQKVWNNTVSMADICHVPLNYVINHGVMLRNTCMISQFVNSSTDYLLPYKHEHPFLQYEGGFVNDPIVGFHTNPIFVLDFNSLYPTTMLAFNICTTTLVHMDDVAQYRVDANTNQFLPHTLAEVRFRDPDGRCISATPYMRNVGFVAADERRGVLPRILDNLLRTRKRLQNELKQTVCPQRRKQLDAQQLSYKLCANAIYGLLGCSFSPLYNPEVAASVTGFGRFLSYVKRECIMRYMAEDGVEGRIIYGDTDSVMVEVCGHTIAQTRRLAIDYADRVTRDIGIPPIRTEYEKIFAPFLIHKKKHYIGVMYVDDCDQHLRIEYKGNEMVRSDNCSLTTDTMRQVIDALFFYGGSSLEAKIDEISARLRLVLADWALLQASYLAAVQPDKQLVQRVLRSATYSKKLSKETYSNRLPHVAVYERNKNRKQYHVGDRIVFCIADTELSDRAKPKKLIDMAYDTDEFVEQRLFLAVPYYLDACIRKPLSRLFATLDPRFMAAIETTLRDVVPVPVATRKRCHPTSSASPRRQDKKNKQVREG